MTRRRVIQFVLLLLVGGAIVNVAVAWGSTQVIKAGYPLDGGTISEWAASLQIQYDMRNARIGGGRGYGAVLVTVETHSFAVRALRAGWPTLSLDGELILQTTSGFPMRASVVTTHNALRICPKTFQRMDDSPAFLPSGILWPGFVINTIFYAAILWVLFFVPGQLKRTLRRRRGLCPACAYPVGTSPVCTECGKPLKAPRAESQIAESPE